MTSNSQPQIAQGQSDAVPGAEAETQQELIGSMTDVPITSSKGSTRWLVYLLGLAAAVVLIFILPSPYSVLLLVALIIASLTIAARDAEVSADSPTANAGRFVAGAQQLFALLTGRTATSADTDSERLGRGFALAAFACMILSAIGFRPAPADTPLDTPVFFMLLGGLALGVSILLSPKDELLTAPTEWALTPVRSRWGFILLGTLLLAVVAEVSARSLGYTLLSQMSNHLQFVLFALGIACLGLGFGGVRVPTLRRVAVTALPWSEILPVLGIFTIALILRLWELNTALRQSVDEALAVEGIYHAWGRSVGLAGAPSGYISTLLYPYWQSVAVDIIGHSLLGIRAVSAVVGALTTIALYVLGRGLFNHKTGLVAAFLLATFPPHVHFSRLGLLHVGDALVGTLMLAFLVMGLKHNRRIFWALAGISLGLTQYFFEAGRLFYPPFVVGCIVALAVVVRGHLRAHWHGLVVTVICALLVAAPVYYTIFAQNLPRASRMDVSGMSTDYWRDIAKDGLTGEEIQQILFRVAFPFRAYVHQPDMAMFYGGDQPLVLMYLVPFLLLGVFYIVWRWRSPAIVVVLWIVAAALGNSLLRDSAVSARFVVVLPALALALAVGVCYALPLVWEHANRAALVLPTVALVAALGTAQVSYYFNVHIPLQTRQLRESTGYDGMDAVLRAAHLPANTQVYIVSNPQIDFNVARTFDTFFVTRDEEMPLMTMLPSDFTREFIAALPHDRNYAFFIAPDDTGSLNLLNEYFQLDPPQDSPFEDVPADRELTLYFAPRGANTP